MASVRPKSISPASRSSSGKTRETTISQLATSPEMETKTVIELVDVPQGKTQSASPEAANRDPLSWHGFKPSASATEHKPIPAAIVQEPSPHGVPPKPLGPASPAGPAFHKEQIEDQFSPPFKLPTPHHPPPSPPSPSVLPPRTPTLVTVLTFCHLEPPNC